MDLSKLPQVRVIKYKSKVRLLNWPSNYSDFVWSPSSCLYPNDSFYFDPNRKPSPLPELIFKTRFSYHRFKNGKIHFRHAYSDDSIFSATTIIMSHSSNDQEQVAKISSPSPLQSIDELNEMFDSLNLLEERLNLEEELFQYKNTASYLPNPRSSDSESPLSRRNNRHEGSKKLSISPTYSQSIVKPAEAKLLTELTLESPISHTSSSRSSFLEKRCSPSENSIRGDPESRGRAVSSSSVETCKMRSGPNTQTGEELVEISTRRTRTASHTSG